jgi:hypothetical protein
MMKQRLKAARTFLVLIAALGSTAACFGAGITPAPNLVAGHPYPQYAQEGRG